MLFEKLNELQEVKKEITKMELKEQKRCRGARKVENNFSHLEDMRKKRNKLVAEISELMQNLEPEMQDVIEERYFRGKAWKVIYELSGYVADDDEQWDEDKDYAKREVDKFVKKIIGSLKKF